MIFWSCYTDMLLFIDPSHKLSSCSLLQILFLRLFIYVITLVAEFPKVYGFF
jgi:hypothetical protein